MPSPYLVAAAARCRAPAPLQTHFMIWCKWPGEVRLFSIEAPMIQTFAEAVTEVREHDNAVMVTRHDPDCPPRDVSEDIARAWLHDMDLGPVDTVPAFVRRHLRDYELAGAGGLK